MRKLTVLATLLLVFGALLVLQGGDRAVATHGPACGDTLTADTTLDSDLDCSGPGGTALIIGANGMTLDCRGHTLTGDGTTGAGVDLGSRTGVTVKNCTATGFGNGFELQGSHGDTLEKNTASDGVRGFLLDDSADNTLKRNTARDNVRQGFLLEDDSDRNTLERNTAIENGRAGFRLDGSNDNTLKRNTARDNDRGFRLDGSNGNTLEKNTARDRLGIELEESHGIRLRAGIPRQHAGEEHGERRHDRLPCCWLR